MSETPLPGSTSGRRSLQFGIVFLPCEPEELVRRVRAAEAAGFDLVGLGDSHSVAREVFVSLALAANSTSHVRIGPTVANLVTRHPTVAASAICALHEASGGRAFLGLGSGDSAVYGIGRKAVSVKQLRDGVVALRDLVRGRAVDWQGVHCRLEWADRDVPVLVSAEGPRTLSAAAEVADGIILGGGADAGSIARSMAHVAGGLERAGRARGELELWSYLKVGLGPDPATAVEGLKMTLAAGANHTFRHGYEGKGVPDELVPRLEELKAAYDYRHHVRSAGVNARLIDRLRLTEWLARRFAIVGSPTQCIARLAELAQSGLDGVLIPALSDDPVSFVQAFGRDVLHPFKQQRGRA